MARSSGGKVEVVRYFMSTWWGICSGPVDKLLSITISDKKVWEGSITDGTSMITIDDQDAFGGIKKEGGVLGSITFLSGVSNQTLPEYLAAKFGLTSSTMPAHRGIASIFLSGGVSGAPDGDYGNGATSVISTNLNAAFAASTINNEPGFYWRANVPQVPPIEVEVQRSPKALDSTKAMIGLNANPIHCIYEVLTNKSWGIGMATSDVLTSSFSDASVTVFNEGIGVSIMWKAQQTAEEFINELLAYVNGVPFTDPSTGKFGVKLIRGGYDTSTLFEITPVNANLSGFQRKMWGDTINELVVTWTNPESEETETVTVQDLGNIAMQGAVVSDPRDYKGLRRAEDAVALGKRDMRVAASPLATCKAVVNRQAYGVTPGDVVKLTWPEHGMSNVPMRVTEADYGEEGDSSITLNLMEDVFSLNTGEYFVPTGSALAPASILPRNPQQTLVTTLPYHLLKRNGIEPSTLVDPEVRVAVMAADTSLDIRNYIIKWQTTNAAGNAVWRGAETRSLISRSTLTADAGLNTGATTMSITKPTVGQGFSIGAYVIIGAAEEDQEIGVVNNVGISTVTIQRGMMDTVPKLWPTGTPIWFIPARADIIDDVERDATVGVTYRLLTTTSKGTLKTGDASNLTAPLTRRPFLPLRPANCKVQGATFGPVSRTSLSNLSLTWANRNRTLEDSVLLKWTDASVTPEVGQTTTIRVYAADLTTILHEVNGLTGTSYTLPTSVFGTEAVAYVRFYAKNAAGDLSLQSHKIQITA